MYFDDKWVAANYQTASKLVGGDWKPLNMHRYHQFVQGAHNAPLALFAHLMNHAVIDTVRKRMSSDRFCDADGRACFLSDLVVMFNDQDQLLLMLPLEAAQSSKDGYSDNDFVAEIRKVLAENGLSSSAKNLPTSSQTLKTHKDGMPFRVVGTITLEDAHALLQTMRNWCEQYDLDSRYANHLDGNAKVSLFPDWDQKRMARKFQDQLGKAGYSPREIQAIAKEMQGLARTEARDAQER